MFPVKTFISFGSGLLLLQLCFVSSFKESYKNTDKQYYDHDYQNYDQDEDDIGKRIQLGEFKLSEDANDIKFLLFADIRNENSSEELLIDDVESIKDSRFKPDQNTIFLIHGFWSNSTSGMPVTLKKGFLDAGLPLNIIVVDWGKLSAPEPKNGIFAPLAYPFIVKRNIPTVYERVADFIQFLLNENFTTLKKLQIVGHSLGAHISGGVGRTIWQNEENNGSKIARISGLDPAGPLFQGVRVQRRLTREDADFVDIYHTAAGTLGTVVFNEGHVNFLPNGGHHQPGCVDMSRPLLEAEFGSCSHSFASKIYAASITKNFTACKCDPKFVDFVVGNSCPGDCAESVLAGYPCPTSTRGQFYFETTEDPFSEMDGQ